jgi:hypothetical protein
MKLHRILSWKMVAVCLALAFMAAPVLLPAVTSAAGPQVDVCHGGPDCNKFINDYVNPAIKVLTALVGIVAVLSIVIAGIQYASSADDPGTVTKAKQRIFNVGIGLVAYIFLLSFLNYLVPGGLF